MIKNVVLKVEKKFFDKYDLKTEYKPGDIIELSDIERVKSIAKQGLAKLVKIEGDYECKGKPVVIYTSRIFEIGGIETACENIAEAFKDKNVTFVFGEADIEQALRVAQYRPVKIDDGSEIKCDVFLAMGYDGLCRLRASKLECRKIYHQIHADWTELRKQNLYKDYKLDKKGVDRFLAVSDTAQKGLKDTFGFDSVVVPNILMPPKYGNFRIFLTLSRLEAEKGGKILVNMLERFSEANKRFIWIICGGGSEQSDIVRILSKHPNVILLPSSVENKWILPKVDYLVQTSLCESYCYSAREALSVGVPVIGTNIPELRKIIKDGKTGYLVNMDLSNLDIDKIFNERPNVGQYTEQVDKVWDKVLNGEL